MRGIAAIVFACAAAGVAWVVMGQELDSPAPKSDPTENPQPSPDGGKPTVLRGDPSKKEDRFRNFRQRTDR